VEKNNSALICLSLVTKESYPVVKTHAVRNRRFNTSEKEEKKLLNKTIVQFSWKICEEQ